MSLLALAVGPAFVDNTTDFPGGAPNNLSDSEQVDFGDGDGGSPGGSTLSQGLEFVTAL